MAGPLHTPPSQKPSETASPGSSSSAAASADPSNSPWIVAARLLRPQGRRGELLAEAEASLELFVPGRRLWLAARPDASPAAAAERTVESAWTPTGRNAGRVVLKLTGADSISAAETLAGQLLLLPLADLPALDAGTFRVRDLIGCTLLNGEEPAGTVVEVQFPVGPDGRTRLHDAPDLLVIERPGQTSTDDLVLVPFAQAWLTEVDLAGKRILMHLPAGLLTEPEDDPARDPAPVQSPDVDDTLSSHTGDKAHS